MAPDTATARLHPTRLEYWACGQFMSRHRLCAAVFGTPVEYLVGTYTVAIEAHRYNQYYRCCY
jgi:hypothetical protein